MTTKQVADMVAEFGIPSAYYQFNKDTATAPPFTCFFFTTNNDAIADNSNYVKIEHLAIEVYTAAVKDFELERTVEDVLASHGMVWTKSEASIDSEQLYEVIYEMDVIITEV